jgi:hypothetical protein
MASHNFCIYFTLIKNSNNLTNALAVCNFCIRKYDSLGATQIKPKYYTSNHARLCHNHLTKCSNFHEYNTLEEVQKILKLPIPEDKKKHKLNKNNDGMLYIDNFNLIILLFSMIL